MLRRMKVTRGFSLVELMIVVAILGFIAIGSMKLLDSQTKGVEHLSEQMREISFQREIELILSHNEACKRTLKNKNPFSEEKFSIIRNKLGNISFKVGKKYMDGAIVISDKITVKNVSVPSGSGKRDGSIRLFIPIKKKSQVKRSLNINKTLKLLLNVTVNNNDKIINCIGTASITGFSCDPGKVIVGYNINGMPICKSFVPSSLSCSAQTINGCKLSDANLLETRGICVCKNYNSSSHSCKGNCSYVCFNGKWALRQDNCGLVKKGSCVDATIANSSGGRCRLQATTTGNTVTGSCQSVTYLSCPNPSKVKLSLQKKQNKCKYITKVGSGTCRYKCDNGNWKLNINTCK